MAERTDLSVEWTRSPRIVTVDFPSTQLSMQDLVDTFKGVIEESWDGIYNPVLHSSGGKEELDDATDVGITVTLLDAKIAFAARFSSISSGAATSADPDGKSLINLAATFQADGVVEGDCVVNFADMSVATVISVPFETEIIMYSLQDGTLNTWEIGDDYKVFHVAQCDLDGGNLVAVDDVDIDVGVAMSPVSPTAFTQILKTSSSSATQLEQDAMRYASFQNSVWYKPSSSQGGTEYPSGNHEHPCNNLPDVVEIAKRWGFTTIQVLESTTLGGVLDISGFAIIGKSHVSTLVTLDASLICPNLTIKNCKITGVLDGGTDIFDCNVGDISYVNGQIHNSGLYGNILLDGDKDAVVESCYTIDQDSPPVIDMGGSGQSLAMPNYSGIVTVENLSDSDQEIGIGLAAGHIVLESTISAGTIILSGVGTRDNFTTGTATVNEDGLMNKSGIVDAVWDEQTSEHTGAGSFGRAVASGSSGAGLHSSMQEDDTTATFSVWQELGGEPRTDLDGMTAKVLDSLGAVTNDLGAGTVGANGVFRWTLASSSLAQLTNYVLMVTATKGSDTWHFSRGFAKGN